MPWEKTNQGAASPVTKPPSRARILTQSSHIFACPLRERGAHFLRRVIRPRYPPHSRLRSSRRRRFLWSLKDMPLPDGRTVPEPVEVASLPFSWLVGLSAAGAALIPSAVVPQVSAVGYYDAQSADGAPTELQVVARAAGGTVAVITARVHRATTRSRFVFRNTRSVVLPLGQTAPEAGRGGTNGAANSRRNSAEALEGDRSSTGLGGVEAVPHPNLPLIARLGRSIGGVKGSGGGSAVEVHSWVNGGSHLQCIPCKPRGRQKGQLGHTAGAEPGTKGDDPVRGTVLMSSESFSSDSSSGGQGDNRKDRVAPVFSDLAQKVRSGDELSFVPYALPSLTLGTVCKGEGEGDIKNAMWLADWIGAEALPPALAVIDAKSRLHVFELDDGSSSEKPSAADGNGTGAANAPPPASGNAKADGMVASRTSFMSSTGSLVSLTNSERSLHLKGLMEDTKEPGSNNSPERTSRRARDEVTGSRAGGPPQEKTVVLPLDSKYGLGLTLAFEGHRVRGLI